MEPLKVFLSSTWIDLIPERQAIEQALRQLESIRFVGMEDFGARTETTRQASLDAVDRCHVYVGVLGHRWGSGITEAEYHRAVARGLPCLIYRKSGAPVDLPQSADDAERQSSWLRELSSTHTVFVFDSPAQLATRAIADLHNMLLDRVVVEGGRPLHGDYDARIQRFVAEYLGTPDAPIPFGGRDTEIVRLDRWLADPQAAPYALVAGPAGRGKSALLVHWAARLTGHDDLSLVYFPISIRFRTNLASVAFTSIAARLAKAHDEPWLAGPDTPTEVWREMVATSLRRPAPAGRRILVVLDGADESADWELGPDVFPAAPPERLRVVVSARYLAGDVDARGWIARLGWDRLRAALSLDLPPLSASGVTDVLRKSSLPLETLSHRADVVAELFRLTAGDPLLVQLYVSDLRARGEEVARLKPEDLTGLEPGLEGYFRRWWEDQRALWGEDSPFKEPAVDAVFNALACALGPLRTSELLELLPDTNPVAVWALDDVMSDLRRFVVGDGDLQGYALSHPRLAEYFYDRLASAGREREQDLRYLNWGREWLTHLVSGGRAPMAVPSYLLYFLRPHFDRAGCAVHDYVGMANNAWVQAWERIDKGSYGGFLGDLRRVCEIAAHENDVAGGRGETVPHLAMEIRGALCTSSIASQAAEMSVGLLRALLQSGVWTAEQAIAYATRIPKPEDRLHSLLAMIVATADADRPLALAAGLGELRSLLADERGTAVVRQVLQKAANESDVHAVPSIAGHLLEAACRLARQGITAKQRETVLAAVQEAAALCTASPEQRAIVLSVAAAACDGVADANARVASLTDSVRASSPARAAERLSLLRTAVNEAPDGPVDGRRDGALSAAAQILGAAIAVGQDVEEDAFSLLCTAWQVLPRAESDAARTMVVSSLPAQQLETLLRAARQLTPSQCVQELRAIITETPPSMKQLVARELRADDLLAEPAPDDWRADLEWATAISDTEQVRVWFEGQVSRLPPNECVVLCTQLLRRRSEPALRTFIGKRAVSVTAEMKLAKPAAVAMAALVDLLQPEGLGDSFEAWRPAGVRAGCASVSDIREMLIAAAVPRESLWSAAQHIDRNLEVKTWAGGGRRPWARRMEIVAAHMARKDNGDTGSHASSSVDLTERLAKSAVETVSPPSLAASVRFLVEALNRFNGSIVRDAVPQVLAHDSWGAVDLPYGNVPTGELAEVLALLPSPALWPPHVDTAAALPEIARVLWARDDLDLLLRAHLLNDAPMPDVSREAIFAADLVRGPLISPDVPLRVPQLTRPSDALVTRALTAVRDATHISTSMRADCLVALLPAVREQTLVHWLEGGSTLSPEEFQRLVRALAAFEPDGVAPFGRVLDAVARLASAQQRERWLIELAGHYDSWRIDDAVGVASALPDLRGQLRAWCALMPQLPRDQRAGLLGKALRAAADLADAPEITRALVQMTVDLIPLTNSVLEVATAAANAITERDLRSDALAALAGVLPAEQTATAVVAARRIGDTAPRVRAMRALAESCSTARSEAAARILAAVQSMPPGSARAAALIYVSPVVDPVERWSVLNTAFASVMDTRSGFELSELFEAIAEALVDAPARVMASALTWIERHRPSLQHTRVLLRLLPVLPRHLQLPASVLLVAHGDRDVLTTASTLWSPREFEDTRKYWRRFPVDARQKLEGIASQQHRSTSDFLDAAELDTAVTQQAEQMLQAADTDVSRDAIVRRIARERDLSPSVLLRLAETARDIGDPLLRKEAVRALGVLAPPRLLLRAADAVAAIEPPADRAKFQIRLAARQSGRSRDKSYEVALASAAAEPDPLRRVAAAVACGIAAPSFCLDVLNIVSQTTEVELRIQALHVLIERLPDSAVAAILTRLPGMLPEECCVRVLCDLAAERTGIGTSVLTLVSALHRGVSRGRALAGWAPFLDDRLQSQATDLLDGITTDFAWLEAAAALASRWPAVLTHERAERAAALLADISDDGVTTAWLRAAAAAWPASAARSYADAALTLRDEPVRGEALGWVAAVKGLASSPDLVSAARGIRDPRSRAIALGRFAVTAEAVDEFLLQEALRDARRTGHHAVRIAAAVEMVDGAAIVPAAIFDAILDERQQHPVHAMQALRAVADKLDAEQALEVVQSLPWDRSKETSAECVLLLQCLAPRLAPLHLGALLDSLPSIARPRHISELLASLAPLIEDEGARSSALAVAKDLGQGTWAAQALLAIVDRLDIPRQQQALTALLATPLETERLRRLTAVRPKLASAVLEQWQRAVDEIRPDIRIGWADSPQIPGPGPHSIGVSAAGDQRAIADRIVESLFDELAPAPASARSSPKPAPRGVVSHGPVLTEMLQRLDGMETEDDRWHDIVRTVPKLTSGECLTLLRRLDDYLQPRRHDVVVPLLVSSLREGDRRGFLDVLQRIETPARVGALLRACQPQLSAETRAQFLPLFRAALHDHGRSDRRDALAMLDAWAPVVTLLGGDAAAVATIGAISDVAEQWP